MSRARRAVRVKPVVVDGHRFASASEAMRYQNLKPLAGASLRAHVSTDGGMLVCQWGAGVGGRPTQSQAFCLAQRGRQKYNAQPTTIDGHKFASLHEAKRYIELTRLQAAGVIADLKPHPQTYDLVVNNVRIGRYTPDSEYRVVATGQRIVEDAKSEATRKARDYPLRKKLMLACHGIEIAEA